MKIETIRQTGAINVPVVERIDKRMLTWRVRTDMQTNTDEETGEQINVTFIETQFPYKPSINEVKEFIFGVIDKQTDERILSGFKWNDVDIWLSTENLFNYKAAFDLAIQTQGQNLPVTFKFGPTDNPVYHTFETVEELTDFYTKAMNYINNVLAEGWAKKDSFDFTPYEQVLNSENND